MRLAILKQASALFLKYFILGKQFSNLEVIMFGKKGGESEAIRRQPCQPVRKQSIRFAGSKLDRVYKSLDYYGFQKLELLKNRVIKNFNFSN